MTHPHGDRQAAVDVGFLKPALLHDASPLGAQRRRVLTDTNTDTWVEHIETFLTFLCRLIQVNSSSIHSKLSITLLTVSINSLQSRVDDMLHNI